MELMKAIKKRHSVRTYTSEKIQGEVKTELESYIDQCNKEGGLNMQLVLNEPKAFDCFMSRYGKFSNVKNYIAVVAPKTADAEERCGYYGEKVVLKAQQMGLNTCWVALTYNKIKSAFTVNDGEKLYIVIAIGYGETQGLPHNSKEVEDVTVTDNNPPKWFVDGVKSALYAPTAMNQQKFKFSVKNNRVTATSGLGFYSKIDLGIAKYHFEVGAGVENFKWSSK